MNRKVCANYPLSNTHESLLLVLRRGRVQQGLGSVTWSLKRRRLGDIFLSSSDKGWVHKNSSINIHRTNYNLKKTFNTLNVV